MTKLNMLNVRATKLNSKEAHEVTDGHNAHYSKDNATKKDPIIMEYSPPLPKKFTKNFLKINTKL